MDVLRMMLLIRTFEERVSELYRDSEIPGFVHVCIGQEATVVGCIWRLSEHDVITSTHRGHGHCLAKGLPPGEMLAELMGKETGTCGGRGGSMHIADPARGIFGANGIVAAGLPIAVGAATASVLRKQQRVVVSFFGDGAAAAGAFHESLNLAALWSLPVVFVCENNHYAEYSPEERQHPRPIAGLAAGYGIEAARVNGNDVEEVIRVVGALEDRARAGEGPFLVEADTYRWHGHFEGDPQRYRSPEEVGEWKANDPVLTLRNMLVERGLAEAALDRTTEEVRKEIEEAIEWARSQPEPTPTSLFDHVLAPRPDVSETEVPSGGDVYRIMDAIHSALETELDTDPEVFIAGIDVGAGGNIFGLTRGLHARWPERLRDTPISETAIIGLGVGAAMAGMRPVVELEYLDFLGTCLDQVMNQAAKMRLMTGGRAEMALTIRTQFGAGRSSGAQHSQSLEAILAHIPGLTVVMPATPADAYGLLRTAIRDPNPIIFIEHRLLYGLKGPRPPEEHRVPIGKARIVRQGKDVTVVSMSRMMHEALAAAETVAAEGIDVEVIDLRTIAPLDRSAILESLAKTGRLVIAHEAVLPHGIGAEIAAIACDEGFWSLDAPVFRIGAAPMPAPYAPALERLWLPDRERIADVVRQSARF
jgi:2-oxoisovalerate dehydrogenase E1 component